eukprot:2280301-Pleurochrysis_carterae.AAC.3
MLCELACCTGCFEDFRLQPKSSCVHLRVGACKWVCKCVCACKRACACVRARLEADGCPEEHVGEQKAKEGEKRGAHHAQHAQQQTEPAH